MSKFGTFIRMPEMIQVVSAWCLNSDYHLFPQQHFCEEAQMFNHLYPSHVTIFLLKIIQCV
jgi:hypothetical protein